MAAPPSSNDPSWIAACPASLIAAARSSCAPRSLVSTDPESPDHRKARTGSAGPKSSSFAYPYSPRQPSVPGSKGLAHPTATPAVGEHPKNEAELIDWL